MSACGPRRCEFVKEYWRQRRRRDSGPTARRGPSRDIGAAARGSVRKSETSARALQPLELLKPADLFNIFNFHSVNLLPSMIRWGPFFLPIRTTCTRAPATTRGSLKRSCVSQLQRDKLLTALARFVCGRGHQRNERVRSVAMRISSKSTGAPAPTERQRINAAPRTKPRHRSRGARVGEKK